MTLANETPPSDQDPNSSPIPPYRRLSRLYTRYPPRVVWAVFVFFNTFISIAIIAVAAMLVDTVFIFPSLGASAFLFFSRPLERFASPRSTVTSHAIGLVCGYAALLVFGLNQHPAVGIEGINIFRIFCAGFALATTCALMILFDVGHAPAASTTLIVALGIVTQPLDLIVLEIAVIALTVQGLVINRAEGLNVPL